MDNIKKFKRSFFKDKRGNKPVKEWLMSLPLDHKKTVCNDIVTISFWDINKSNKEQIARYVAKNLWQVYNPLLKTHFFFTVYKENIILIDGFIASQKQNKIIIKHFNKAKRRLKEFWR